MQIQISLHNAVKSLIYIVSFPDLKHYRQYLDLSAIPNNLQVLPKKKAFENMAKEENAGCEVKGTLFLFYLHQVRHHRIKIH